MGIQIYDFASVIEKAKELGCNIPTGLALLPRNFESAESKEDLLHESSTPTVRIIFRKQGIKETPLEYEGEKFPQISEKKFDEWVGPIIFASYALLSQNPHIISIALGVISNYLTDFFKGIPGEKRAKLDVVVETKNRKFKRVHYEGPISGLGKILEIIREVSSSDK